MKDQAFLKVLKRMRRWRPSPEDVRVHGPFGARRVDKFDVSVVSSLSAENWGAVCCLVVVVMVRMAFTCRGWMVMKLREAEGGNLYVEKRHVGRRGLKDCMVLQADKGRDPITRLEY